MKARFVNIDQDTALDWLTANTHNRPLNKNWVRRLVEDLKNNRWQDNGETIKFDTNHVLLDGQHRLMAIAESGISAQLLVVEGLDPEVQATIDIGNVRSAGHILAMNGVTNGNKVAATAKMVLRYDRNPHLVWNGSSDPTKTEIVNFSLENADELMVAVRFAEVVRATIKVMESSYAAFSYMVLRDSKHVRRWDDWHEGIVTGADLHNGDPRLAFRNYNLRRMAKTKGSWEQQMNMAIAIKAWNLWALKKESQILRFNQIELPMPKIR